MYTYIYIYIYIYIIGPAGRGVNPDGVGRAILRVFRLAVRGRGPGFPPRRFLGTPGLLRLLLLLLSCLLSLLLLLILLLVITIMCSYYYHHILYIISPRSGGWRAQRRDGLAQENGKGYTAKGYLRTFEHVCVLLSDMNLPNSLGTPLQHP